MKLPKYIKGYVDHTGKPRHYFRRAGAKPVALPGLPWSPEFMAAHAAAMAGYEPPETVVIGATGTAPGSVSAALVSYYENSAFTQGLAPGTRSARRNLLERFRSEHGDKRIRKLERRHVQAYVSSLEHATVQRSMLQALKHFLGHCASAGLIADNPAEGVTKAKMKKTSGFYAWTEEDAAKYEARHPVGTKARLALALYLNLGIRKSDVVRVGPSHIKNGELADFLPQKTSHSGGRMINVPLTADTKAIIAATPLVGTKTFLVTNNGQPFTAKGFGNKMREWCDEAGLPDCASHGLRKLCLVRLADIEGIDVLDLQAISGHKDLRELQIYIENANRKRRARRAIAQLENAKRSV